MHYLSLFLVAFLMFSCGGEHSHQGDAADNNEAKVILSADILDEYIDPVCRMDMRHFTIADTTKFDGKVYGFCHPGCKEAFLNETDKYLN